MWILLAGILMCYLLGFLVYCCYRNARCRGRWTNVGFGSTDVGIGIGTDGITSQVIGEDVENPSAGSPPSSTSQSQSQSGNESNCRANARFGFGLGLLPLSCLYDEITQRNSDLPQHITAQREQQLRQIKLEINELSRRLGLGQLYRERHQGQHYVHLPLTTRHMFIQPVQHRTINNNTNRNRHRRTGPQGQGHNGEINYEGSPGSCSLEMSFLSLHPSPSTRNNTASGSTATTTTNSACSSLSSTETLFPLGLSHLSPERTNSNGIFLERERRLRLSRLRMEIEDLTFQLSSLSEDRSNSENNAGGLSISSSELEGLVFEPDSNSEDDDDEDGGATTNNSYSFRYEDDELPSYDESQSQYQSIIIIDEQMEESPPPSYAQCTHLQNLNLLNYSSQSQSQIQIHTGSSSSSSSDPQQNRNEPTS